MPADGLHIGAWFATLSGIAASGAGLLIVIRNSRSKGRKAAIHEADAMEIEVTRLREEIVENRRAIYALERKLANKGIT